MGGRRFEFRNWRAKREQRKPFRHVSGGAAFGLSRNQNSRPVVISGFNSIGSTNWGSSTKALLTFVLTVRPNET
jgi:hypothetical protein